MLIEPQRLAAELVRLVEAQGGEATEEQMRSVIAQGVAAAQPGGPRDLTPHEILLIRLAKNVASRIRPEIYRDGPRRRALKAEIGQLLEAHGVPRGIPRLARLDRD